VFVDDVRTLSRAGMPVLLSVAAYAAKFIGCWIYPTMLIARIKVMKMKVVLIANVQNVIFVLV
jgi:hypothetical protein